MKMLLLLILTGIHISTFSQVGARPGKKLYKISVSLYHGGKSSGFIADVEDTAVHIVPSAASIRYNSYSDRDVEKVNYSDISKIVVRRKGSTGRGMLYGALIGLGTGVVAGLISGSDPVTTQGNPDLYGFDVAMNNAFRMTAGEKAVLLGLGGSLNGALIGGIIGGLARKTFIIGGKKEKFKEMQLNVLDKVYGKRPASE